MQHNQHGFAILFFGMQNPNRRKPELTEIPDRLNAMGRPSGMGLPDVEIAPM